MGDQALTALEVPGEPGVYWCARHIKEKTLLRCGRCEKPICTRCVVYSPAGTRCRECSSTRNLHIYRVSPLHYLYAFVAALAFSALGAFIFQNASFVILFYAVFASAALGKITSAITRGKRGVPLAVVVSAGAVLGALLPAALMFLFINATLPHGTARMFSGLIMFENPFLWLYIILVVPTLWHWIR